MHQGGSPNLADPFLGQRVGLFSSLVPLSGIEIEARETHFSGPTIVPKSVDLLLVYCPYTQLCHVAVACSHNTLRWY
jgi:hypothetical protein